MDYFEYCGSKIMIRDGPIVTSYNWEETEKQSRTNKIRMMIFTVFCHLNFIFLPRFNFSDVSRHAWSPFGG